MTEILANNEEFRKGRSCSRQNYNGMSRYKDRSWVISGEGVNRVRFAQILPAQAAQVLAKFREDV